MLRSLRRNGYLDLYQLCREVGEDLGLDGVTLDPCDVEIAELDEPIDHPAIDIMVVEDLVEWVVGDYG